MDGVILVQHDGGRKKYAFAVPKELAAHCHSISELLVETRYGLRIVSAASAVKYGEEAEAMAKKAGAGEVLRPVVGVITPQIRLHVREQVFDELVRNLQYKMFAERFALRTLEAGCGE